MRLLPFLVVILFAAPGFALGSTDAQESPPRPIQVDPIDHNSMWTVVEGDGTATIQQDAQRAERVFLRVDGAPEGRTRVVGPSMPAELPVRVGFLVRAGGFDTLPREVRLIDVDGGLMARITTWGLDYFLTDAQGNSQHIHGCVCAWQAEDYQILLTESSVVVRAWDTGHTIEIPAVSDKAFDHVEMIVGDKWLELDHVTVIPEGSGFVDFFERHTLEAPDTPWQLDGSSIDETIGNGAFATRHAGRLAENSRISFEDPRLGLHRHEVDLHFKAVQRIAVLRVPVLYGVGADGAATWSVEFTHVRPPNSEMLSAVTVKTVDGQVHELVPLGERPRSAWSALRVVTDPQEDTLHIEVDGHARTFTGQQLGGLRGLGIGDGPSPRVGPVEVAVDGVVAGYR